MFIRSFLCSYAHGVDSESLALMRHTHAFRKGVLEATAPGSADRRSLLAVMSSLSPELPVEQVRQSFLFWYNCN